MPDLAEREFEQKAALGDLIEGARRWRSWITLAYYDFVSGFRRTVVGPFWQPLHIAAWITGLWLIFGGNRGNASLEYIAIGVVFWSLFQSFMTSGTVVFEQNRVLILSIPNPLSLHLYRRLAFQTIKWATNLPILMVLLIVLGTPIGSETFYFVPGILLVMVNGLWTALLFAIIASRFRDFQFAVDAATRLLFFLTPVFWSVGNDPTRSLIARYNPFTYFLEIVREPLLGNSPSLLAWQIVFAFTVCGLLLSVLVYGRTRRFIVFWI